MWPHLSGVLLLNAVLTVRAHQANSHKDKGWEIFTDAVVQWLSNNQEGLVFMLWGAYAQKKGAAINRVGLHCPFNTIKTLSTQVPFIFTCLNFYTLLALQKRHHILQAVHPSPLSAHRGFFGCKHFSKANELLEKSGKSPIDWKALWVSVTSGTCVTINYWLKPTHKLFHLPVSAVPCAESFFLKWKSSCWEFVLYSKFLKSFFCSDA